MFYENKIVTHIPLFDTSKGIKFSHMFRMCENLTAIPPIDLSNAKEIRYFVYGCGAITELPLLDISKTTDTAYAFGNTSIVTIKLKVSETTGFSNTFYLARGLENLIIEGTIAKNGFDVQYSSKLTHESLMSIINALQDKSTNTSGTTWTVTLGTKNKEKLTTEEKAIAENKGWNVA